MRQQRLDRPCKILLPYPVFGAKTAAPRLLAQEFHGKATATDKTGEGIRSSAVGSVTARRHLSRQSEDSRRDAARAGSSGPAAAPNDVSRSRGAL
jgi:hypothetical protein